MFYHLSFVQSNNICPLVMQGRVLSPPVTTHPAAATAQTERAFRVLLDGCKRPEVGTPDHAALPRAAAACQNRKRRMSSTPPPCGRWTDTRQEAQPACCPVNTASETRPPTLPLPPTGGRVSTLLRSRTLGSRRYAGPLLRLFAQLRFQQLTDVAARHFILCIQRRKPLGFAQP